MFCDYKKPGIVKLIAVSTVVQAILGIAIVALLYSQIDGLISNPTEDNSTITTTTEATTTTVATSTSNGANTSVDKPEIKDDGDFLLFFAGINQLAVLYSGITELRVWYGIVLIVDSLWIISVVVLLMAINQSTGSRLRYQYLLPWIATTLLVCIVDVAGTVYFVYTLMSHGEEEVQLQLNADTGEITQFLFLQLFFSKAGVFWLVNVASLVMIAQSYSYWKGMYEEEESYNEKSGGVELAPYDGSVRHKPYERGYQPQMPDDDDDDFDETAFEDGYSNKGYQGTPPDQPRYTANPLHNQQYPSEPPVKYRQNDPGGDFRRFSAVDDYNAAEVPQKNRSEKYPENRDQGRRDSCLPQNEPSRMPSQSRPDPYRKPSQSGPDPYRKPSQSGPDPYRKPSQSGPDPYRRASRDSQPHGRSGLAPPSNYGAPIPEEDYDNYKREPQWPGPTQHAPQPLEHNNYQQQKPSPRNPHWGQPNPPSHVQGYPSAQGRPQSQSDSPYYQRPDRDSNFDGESPQRPTTRARDQYNPPRGEAQPQRQSLNPTNQPQGKKSPTKQQRAPRQDDELPMRSQLYAGAPPPDERNRPPSFTYLPQIQADKPYNIPRVNLK